MTNEHKPSPRRVPSFDAKPGAIVPLPAGEKLKWTPQQVELLMSNIRTGRLSGAQAAMVAAAVEWALHNGIERAIGTYGVEILRETPHPR